MSTDLFALAGDLGFERKRFLQAVRSLQSAVHVQITSNTMSTTAASPLFESMMQQIESLMKCTERMSALTQSLESELFKEKQVQAQPYLKAVEQMCFAMSQEYKRPVQTRIKGSDVHVNKDLLDRFTPLFLKLIRPFIEFGIESEIERIARKKNATAQLECSIQPVFGGHRLRLVSDGNGIIPPYSLELGKALAKVGVRGQFEGKPGVWSAWTFYLPNQTGAQRMLPVHIQGVMYGIPAWAITRVNDDYTLEVSAGFGRRTIEADNVGEPFEAYMKPLEAEFTVSGKYNGVVLHNSEHEELLSLVLNPAHLVYEEKGIHAS